MVTEDPKIAWLSNRFVWRLGDLIWIGERRHQPLGHVAERQVADGLEARLLEVRRARIAVGVGIAGACHAAVDAVA